MTTIIGILPLVSGLLPDKISLYLFPPLDIPYRFVTIVLAALVTLVLYHLQDGSVVKSRKRRFRCLTFSFGLTVAGACLFLIAGQRFVRKIAISSEDKTVAVIVGYQRTDFAKEQFPARSDWEILIERGQGEEEIGKIWTASVV